MCWDVDKCWDGLDRSVVACNLVLCFGDNEQRHGIGCGCGDEWRWRRGEAAGRTRRGPMTGRVVMVGSSLEKAEGGVVNVKSTRVGRPTEAKSAGPGRPKSGGSDRKISSWQRHLLGNNGSEEDNDHEHLAKVVQQVVDMSGESCCVQEGCYMQLDGSFGYLFAVIVSFNGLEKYVLYWGALGLVFKP